MAFITCKDLAVGYDQTIVCENINFEVNRGDYLYIIGENGAGKSTLMKTLLHLIRPVGGSFEVGDGLMPYEIGYLPQQTVVQKDFPASVEEIVLSGTIARRHFRAFYSKEDKKTAKENMQRMNVWELRKKCYRNLSGGQQQRVLLARALCATTKLLLLDEPVTGLDPKVSIEFYQCIENLNKEGTTIIMVSHDLNAAMKYASHILHIGKEDFYYGEKERYIESEQSLAFQMLGGEE